MLIYTSKVARDSDRFLTSFCGAASGIALAASATFFSGLL
jgi:hypothetical protein